MLAGTDDLDLFFADRATFLRDLDLSVAAEIFGCERSLVLHQLLERACKHDLAAKFARVRPDVERRDRPHASSLVMLDDEQRVADVAKIFEYLDEPRIVSRMKADARLVKHVKRADKQRTEICRKLNTLCLAA